MVHPLHAFLILTTRLVITLPKWRFVQGIVASQGTVYCLTSLDDVAAASLLRRYASCAPEDLCLRLL